MLLSYNYVCFSLYHFQGFLFVLSINIKLYYNYISMKKSHDFKYNEQRR